jgi:hypothetical protein
MNALINKVRPKSVLYGYKVCSRPHITTTYPQHHGLGKKKRRNNTRSNEIADIKRI